MPPPSSDGTLPAASRGGAAGSVALSTVSSITSMHLQQQCAAPRCAGTGFCDHFRKDSSPRAETAMRARQPPGASGAGVHSSTSFRDRKSVVEGKSVSERVDFGGRRYLKTK